ncbi:hypothetical protein GCM10009864_78740 [Streptomyces lunalinharesii]|uniref:Uncharacterized protein n=1 Tax=Streptomyces lunalinharesii TaxID=333384 RepID=A0ABP6FJV4_9ACTN
MGGASGAGDVEFAEDGGWGAVAGVGAVAVLPVKVAPETGGDGVPGPARPTAPYGRSRRIRSAYVSRRTTARCAPSRTKTTGGRRAPL